LYKGIQRHSQELGQYAAIFRQHETTLPLLKAFLKLNKFEPIYIDVEFLTEGSSIIPVMMALI